MKSEYVYAVVNKSTNEIEKTSTFKGVYDTLGRAKAGLTHYTYGEYGPKKEDFKIVRFKIDNEWEINYT